jgi:hypothetical protein
MSTYSIKTNMENWKKIQGFEDYAISDKGNIKRETTTKGYPEGTLLKPKLQKNGYLSKALHSNKKNYTKLIHRLVAEAFIPNPLNKLTVNHINGKKTDNRVENLEWNTYSENQLHAYDNGLCRGPIGEKQGRSKLKEYQVLEIVELSKIGLTQNEIKRKYDISQGLVSKIINKKTWVHI